jgi:hypothetical protein
MLAELAVSRSGDDAIIVFSTPAATIGPHDVDAASDR